MAKFLRPKIQPESKLLLNYIWPTVSHNPFNLTGFYQIVPIANLHVVPSFNKSHVEISFYQVLFNNSFARIIELDCRL